MRDLKTRIINYLFTPFLEHPIANEPSYYDSNDSEDDSTMYSIRDTSRYAQHDSSNRTGVRRMTSSIASGRVAPTLGVGRQTTLSVTDTSRFGLQASGVVGRQNTNTLSVTGISRFGVQARPTQGLSVSAAGRTTTGVTGLSVSGTSRFAYANENSQGPTSQLSTVNSSQRAAPSIIDNSRFAYAKENSQGQNSQLNHTSRFSYANEASEGPNSVMDSARETGIGRSSVSVVWKPPEQIADETRFEFYLHLSKFIVETGIFSIACALLPMLYVYVLAQVGKDTMEFYTGDDAEFPSARMKETSNSSMVVIPAANAYRLMYFNDPQGETTLSLEIATAGYWFATIVPNYIRSQILFPQKNRFGTILCIVITVAMSWFLSHLHIAEKEYSAKHGVSSSNDPTKGFNATLVLFGVPALFVVAFYNSGFYLSKDPRRLLSCYWTFFCLQIVEIAVTFVYTWYFLPLFFNSRSNLLRFSIRIFGSLVIVKILVETVWNVSAKLVTDFGVDLQDSPLLVLAGANLLPLLARLMQGSAKSLEESLLYEVAGTLAELSFADCLLKGRTPFLHYWMNIFWVSRHLRAGARRVLVFFRGKSNKVGVEERGGEGEEEEEGGEGEKEKGDENAEGEEEPEEEEVEEEPVLRDKVRIIFCETTMVVFIIAEASALVVSTSFWLLMHANPAKPGSYAIPVSQTIINFFVMIVGECIVTDGIIAILSHHLTSRFKVDLPATWKHMKQYKSKMLVAIVATISLNSFVVLAPVGTTLCFTHRVDTTVEELVVEVEDLVMTSCPEPPENVTQFDLVGRMFYEQWSKYYYSD